MTERQLDLGGLAEAVKRQIALSRRALWAERLADALWPAFTVACFAVAAALLGVFESLGPTAHRAGLALAGIAFLAALGIGLRRLRRPRAAEAADRLDAGDPARPLSVLTDRMAGEDGAADPVARALWAAHRQRAEAAAARLAAAAPDLRLSARDRWALRLFAPALAVAAFVGAGDRWEGRLGAALEPLPSEARTGAVAAAPAAAAWAVPPTYTRLDTVSLVTGDEAPAGPVDLPEGSEITLRVTGADIAPVLGGSALAGIGGFTDLGAGLWEARGVLAGSGDLSVTLDGERLGGWQIAMTPDAPPTIARDGRPAPTATRALEVPFKASDDYGLTAAWAEIALAEPGARPMKVEAPEFGLPLPISGDPREIAEIATADFTRHPWAGAEVLLTLHAEDGAGQTARTEPIRLTLPGRVFTDRMARALVDQRRALVIDLDRAGHVLDTVQAVSQFPEAVYGDDHGAYLGVRTAVRRLAHAIVEERVAGAAPTVAEFLWRAALSLEDGDAANALERLRQAEERLREALQNGSEEEVAAAMQEMREAMNEYLRELARQALENPQANQQQQQQQQQGQQLSQQDLERMLEEMQRQAESGMRDQAQAMLDQLSRMLENLRAGQQQAGQSPGQQAMQQLQDMIQRQRDLSDETFDELRRQQRGQQGQQGQQQGQQGQQQSQGQQGQQGQRNARPGGEGGPGSQQGRHGENGRLAAEQDALRRALEQLRGQLGGGEGMDGASRALEEAERAMGRAEGDLQSDNPGGAVEDQMDALDNLNDGAEALAEAMQNGQGQQAAQGSREGAGRAGDAREADPFDRPAGSFGAIDGTGTEVPDRETLDRARELLEELRRRSSDQTRPPLELDYLRRLLERF